MVLLFHILISIAPLIICLGIANFISKVFISEEAAILVYPIFILISFFISMFILTKLPNVH